jgi:hypothetical protein
MLRLKSRPHDRQLAAMSRRFADILSDGAFSLVEPPAGEPDEPELTSLVRLVFHFNRRNHGRLRQLIDWINQEVGA